MCLPRSRLGQLLNGASELMGKPLATNRHHVHPPRDTRTQVYVICSASRIFCVVLHCLMVNVVHHGDTRCTKQSYMTVNYHVIIIFILYVALRLKQICMSMNKCESEMCKTKRFEPNPGIKDHALDSFEEIPCKPQNRLSFELPIPDQAADELNLDLRTDISDGPGESVEPSNNKCRHPVQQSEPTRPSLLLHKTTARSAPSPNQRTVSQEMACQPKISDADSKEDEPNNKTTRYAYDLRQASEYLAVKSLTDKCTVRKTRTKVTHLFIQECLQQWLAFNSAHGNSITEKQNMKSEDASDSEEQTTEDSVILKELTSAPTMRFAPGVEQKVATYMVEGPEKPVSLLTAEHNRLASFVDNTKVPKSGVWVTRLAAAGFYCPEKNSSFVKCAFCDVDVKIEDLRGSGDPMELHRRHSPFCSFVKGQSSNVTLQLQGQIAGLNVIHGFFGDTSPRDQEHSSRGVKDQHKDTPISGQEQRGSRECLQSSASASGHGSGGGAARIQSSAASAPRVSSTSLPTNPSPRGVSSPSLPASMPAASSHRSHTPVNSLHRGESSATGRTAGVETAPTGHHAQSRHSPDPNVTVGSAGLETARRGHLAQAASSHAQGSVTPMQLTESARSQNTHVTQSSPSSGPVRAPATESALPFQTAQPINTHQQETSSSSQTSSASASTQASTHNSASQSNSREAVAHPGPAPQAPPPSSTGEPERQVVTYSQLGIYTQEPKRSDFAIAATRAGSFTAWPHPDTHNPQDMAEAGFYYVGQDDLVRCFYCKGGLKSWAPHLRPWVEHARFFPKCPFVGQVKGQDFVDVVQELKERQETISAEQVEEELTARQRDTQALSTLPPPEGAVGGVSAAVGGADENTDVTQLAKVADDLETENKEILDARICKICQINDVSILFLPCGHLVSCAQCAPALRTCAICRQRVKGRVRVIEK